MAEVNIPPGKGIPLVDLETDLLPEPTMTALDARYTGAGILDDDQTSTTKVWSSEKTSTEIDAAVDGKADLVGGVVPDSELPTRLAEVSLDARYANADILNDGAASGTTVWSSEKTASEIGTAVEDKANLVAGVVPDAELPTRLSSTSLHDTFLPLDGEDAQITGRIKWRAAPGAGGVLTAKPLGDGSSGVIDITHDDTTGYLFHTHSGPNSGPLGFHYGGGADQGSGGVFLFAAKNAGKGLTGTSHPSHTGTGVDLTFYSSVAASFVMNQYAGAQGAVVQQKAGKGFPDGVTTLGSTTFTSATAAFTSGDVGKAITQLTSRGEAYGIDTGTTISSVTNATTVVLSKPAIASSTGINFSVADRAVPAGQKFISFFNSAAQEVFHIANNYAKVSVPFEAAAAPSGTVDSTFIAGGLMKFYAYDGANYTTSQIRVDAFGLRLEHYVSAAKGAEASAVRSFIGRNVGGVPYVGFLGATAQPRQTLPAAATDAATTQTLANSLRTVLIAFGLAQ